MLSLSPRMDEHRICSVFHILCILFTVVIYSSNLLYLICMYNRHDCSLYFHTFSIVNSMNIIRSLQIARPTQIIRLSMLSKRLFLSLCSLYKLFFKLKGAIYKAKNKIVLLNGTMTI